MPKKLDQVKSDVQAHPLFGMWIGWLRSRAEELGLGAAEIAATAGPPVTEKNVKDFLRGGLPEAVQKFLLVADELLKPDHYRSVSEKICRDGESVNVTHSAALATNRGENELARAIFKTQLEAGNLNPLIFELRERVARSSRAREAEPVSPVQDSLTRERRDLRGRAVRPKGTGPKD